MKKILILCLVIFLLAVAFETPSIDITGLFLKASSAIVTVARAVIKQVLSAIVSML